MLGEYGRVSERSWRGVYVVIYFGYFGINDQNIVTPLKNEFDKLQMEYTELWSSYYTGEVAFDIMSKIKPGDVVIAPNHMFFEWMEKVEVKEYRQVQSQVHHVWVMHEFVSSKLSMVQGLRFVDYACVPNDYVEQYLVDNGLPRKKIWPVGYVQLDTLWQSMEETLVQGWIRFGSRVNRVLVCPTMNYAINGKLEWLEGLKDLASVGTWSIDFKGHELSESEDFLYGRCGEYVNTKHDWINYLSVQMDLCEILPHYDVVVSDGGSAPFLALMAGASVMVYDSYRWWEDDKAFDPKDAAFTMRDLFYTFHSPRQLEILLENMSGPLVDDDLVLPQMSTCRGENLFDGLVARRIAVKVKELLA